MQRLVIIGAGGHGKVVADTAAEAGWQEIVFADGDWPARTEHAGWEIIGSDAGLLGFAEDGDCFVVAIGDARRRQDVSGMIRDNGLALATIAHPAAVVSRRAQIGAGTVIFAGAVVNAGAVVGMGCIINTGAIVEHDCVVEDWVHVCPGVALGGAVIVGARSWIGIGSSVRQGTRIGTDVLIGAGSAVVKGVPSGAIAYGVPARVIGSFDK